MSDKEVLTDSNAARGMASRRGLGRTRHIDVKRLWLQEVVETRGVHLVRVDGKNPGDPLTKLQAYDEMMNLLRMTGVASDGLKLSGSSAPSDGLKPQVTI